MAALPSPADADVALGVDPAAQRLQEGQSYLGASLKQAGAQVVRFCAGEQALLLRSITIVGLKA